MKTGYDNPEAFSPEQALQNELTNRAMANYNEQSSWGNTLGALGRDAWSGIMSMLSGKAFQTTPLPAGYVKMSELMARGEPDPDPNQTIGGINPQDHMDILGGPPTPDNPERGGWGWGNDTGGGGAGRGGLGGTGDFGGDDGTGRGGAGDV